MTDETNAKAVSNRRTVLGLTAALATGVAAAASGCRRHGSARSTATHASTASATSTAGTGSIASTGGTDGLGGSTGNGTSGPPLLTSRDDLVAPQPEAWESWTLVSPDTIDVTFTSGPTDCEGVNAQVTETDEDVTINLMVGGLPEGPDACKAIAVEAHCQVTLSRELGERTVRQDAI